MEFAGEYALAERSVHLLPCRLLPSQTPNWGSGQGLRQAVTSVVADGLTLCPTCWPEGALHEERQQRGNLTTKESGDRDD